MESETQQSGKTWRKVFLRVAVVLLGVKALAFGIKSLFPVGTIWLCLGVGIQPTEFRVELSPSGGWILCDDASSMRHIVDSLRRREDGLGISPFWTCALSFPVFGRVWTTLTASKGEFFLSIDPTDQPSDGIHRYGFSVGCNEDAPLVLQDFARAIRK